MNSKNGEMFEIPTEVLEKVRSMEELINLKNEGGLKFLEKVELYKEIGKLRAQVVSISRETIPELKEKRFVVDGAYIKVID